MMRSQTPNSCRELANGLYAKKGPRVIQNTFHIQTINNMHRRFEDFMRPFCGPANNNLSSYTAWFLARIASNDGTAEESAWSRMMAV